MPSIARKNLLKDFSRFLVAQAGIMFAVSLVTIQTGLQSGFARSSSLIIDNSKADIWVSSKKMVQLDLTLPIPFERLSQAQRVAGVDRVEALILRGGLWRDRADNIASVSVIGSDPDGQLFSPWHVTSGNVSDLKAPYTVMVDETSLNKLGVKVGESGAIGSRKARVVGLTTGSQSLVLGSSVFTSLKNANAYLNSPLTDEDASPSTPTLKDLSSTDRITYLLVRAKPGENLQALKQRLEAALPKTSAYTRA